MAGKTDLQYKLTHSPNLSYEKFSIDDLQEKYSGKAVAHDKVRYLLSTLDTETYEFLMNLLYGLKTQLVYGNESGVKLYKAIGVSINRERFSQEEKQKYYDMYTKVSPIMAYLGYDMDIKAWIRCPEISKTLY